MGNAKEKVYEFVIDYLNEHGTTPTYQRIGEAIGASGATAFNYVRQLVAEGRLRIDGHRVAVMEGKWIASQE